MPLTKFGEHVVVDSETTESLIEKLLAIHVRWVAGERKRAGEILSITCALYLHLQG